MEPPSEHTAEPAPESTTPTPPPAEAIPEGPERFINRELSWQRFNERVLEEALDDRTPLLDRVNFLSIFGSNLDEHFMIRVSGLRRQMEAGVVKAPPDGMTPAEQLAAIRAQLLPSLKKAHKCWNQDLKIKLREAGINVLRYDELKRRQRKLLRRYFKTEVFPVLTPLAFDPGHPFPHISNLSINLAVVVQEEGHDERFARLKMPQAFPRLIKIPDEDEADDLVRLGLDELTFPNYVWLEEVVAANLDVLFPGFDVVAAYPFRITRDADMDIEEDEAADLLSAMSEYVDQRRFGTAIRLEIDQDMPKHIEALLSQNLRLAPFSVYRTHSPIGLADLRELTEVDRPELKSPKFLPMTPPGLVTEDSLFSVIRKHNVLLYHPYDSFQPVVSFIREAANDPEVLAIKQTLYRVGPNSPIVASLLAARENGKQVAVLVELKARFDEENNIIWARALERRGVHVVYGVMGLKTHTKACLVVRREQEGIRRYVHLGTGNYNPVTARIYTDLGYFTCDPAIAADVTDLFNVLTGVSRKTDYRKLLVAPTSMRKEFLARIDREIEQHQQTGDGHIVFKMNSLTEKACIKALYRASQAGVRVDLQIRGICCLRPGVPGLSENITVTSIVGRFLEHTRIYYFHNGGKEEILTGSADLMGRNLNRRVETLFPIDDPAIRAALRDEVLFFHLRDNVQLRRMLPDGSYERVKPKDGDDWVNTQERLVEASGTWHGV